MELVANKIKKNRHHTGHEKCRKLLKEEKIPLARLDLEKSHFCLCGFTRSVLHLVWSLACLLVSFFLYLDLLVVRRQHERAREIFFFRIFIKFGGKKVVSGAWCSFNMKLFKNFILFYFIIFFITTRRRDSKTKLA